MDNIINEIIDIDRRAQQKYIDADAYRKKTEEEILSEISRLDADTSKKCTDKLNAVRAAQEALYNERMESLSASLNQQKSALKHLYEKNHANWEKELFDKVLGRA